MAWSLSLPTNKVDVTFSAEGLPSELGVCLSHTNPPSSQLPSEKPSCFIPGGRPPPRRPVCLGHVSSFLAGGDSVVLPASEYCPLVRPLLLQLIISPVFAVKWPWDCACGEGVVEVDLSPLVSPLVSLYDPVDESVSCWRLDPRQQVAQWGNAVLGVQHWSTVAATRWLGSWVKGEKPPELLLASDLPWK